MLSPYSIHFKGNTSKCTPYFLHIISNSKEVHSYATINTINTMNIITFLLMDDKIVLRIVVFWLAFFLLLLFVCLVSFCDFVFLFVCLSLFVWLIVFIN